MDQNRNSFYSQIRYLGLITTIPAILLAGPACGYFLGRWVEKRFHGGPWILALFTVIGFLAAAKEMAKIVKQVSDSENTKKGDERP